MLTSTYTLVALSVEQSGVRASLQCLLRDLHALPDEDGILAPGPAAQLCIALRRAMDDCHWRKLDKFLVPALRRATGAVDGLLRDLERISGVAADALAAAEACVDAGARGIARDHFQPAFERCVGALRGRLEREEHELFPLARTLVPGEAWFAIANQMLAHDAFVRERRGAARAGRSAPRDPVERGDARRAFHDPRGHAQGREAGGAEPGRRQAALSLLH